MAYNSIASALDSFLLTFPGNYTIVLEDHIFIPDSRTPYLAAKLSAYTRVNAGFGANSIMQENGFYTITVNRPAVEGRGAAGRMADALVDFFARGTVLATGTGQSLQILYASAQPSQSHGDWLTLPVVVSWFCTEP